jgi:hypothetical protein
MVSPLRRQQSLDSHRVVGLTTQIDLSASKVVTHRSLYVGRSDAQYNSYHPVASAITRRLLISRR